MSEVILTTALRAEVKRLRFGGVNLTSWRKR
jgi:hypothetical protein